MFSNVVRLWSCFVFLSHNSYHYCRFILFTDYSFRYNGVKCRHWRGGRKEDGHIFRIWVRKVVLGGNNSALPYSIYSVYVRYFLCLINYWLKYCCMMLRRASPSLDLTFSDLDMLNAILSMPINSTVYISLWLKSRLTNLLNPSPTPASTP